MGVKSRLRQKWPQLLVYLFLLAGGILASTYRSPTLAQYLQPWVLVVWSAFFIVGSSLSLFGLIKGNWAGEVVGLPLLWSALSVYGAALVISGFSRSYSVPIVTGLILLAFAICLIGRWIESMRMLKIARDA